MRTIAFAGMLLAASAAPALAAGTHHGGHHGYTFGEPGKAAEARRTVAVGLDDEMRIVLDDLKEITLGETIRFVITNRGQAEHEFSIGDAASQRAHAAMMNATPGMRHVDDPAAVTLAPGETGELVWKFSRRVQGQIEFACQVPGHYEAGMKAGVPLKAR